MGFPPAAEGSSIFRPLHMPARPPIIESRFAGGDHRMLLTITTTHTPATDLGYLLHKNPARPQTFPLAFGQAHVFYPEATAERCTAALLLDVDPVGLIRRPAAGGGAGFAL